MAVGWQPQFLITWASPVHCLKVLTTWQLNSSEWMIQRVRGKEATVPFMTQFWEVTQLSFSFIKSKSQNQPVFRGGKIKFRLLKGDMSKYLWVCLKVTLYKVNPSIYTQKTSFQQLPPFSYTIYVYISIWSSPLLQKHIVIFSHLKENNSLQIHCNSVTPLHKTPQRSHH